MEFIIRQFGRNVFVKEIIVSTSRTKSENDIIGQFQVRYTTNRKEAQKYNQKRVQKILVMLEIFKPIIFTSEQYE